MTIECPFCGMENAYCNGVEYVCPDCGKRWDCDDIPDDDRYDDDDEEDDDDFDYEVVVHSH